MIVLGDVVFARIAGELVRATISSAFELGEPVALLTATRISPLAAFGERLVLIADDEWLALDSQGRIRERRTLQLSSRPVPAEQLPAPLVDVHAWLAPDTAFVELADGSHRLARFDGSVALPIRPGFQGPSLVGLRPRVEVCRSRVVWAQSLAHLTVFELDRGLRPQIVGGVDRLASPVVPVVALWLSADNDRAAVLAHDGSLERFDLVHARPLDRVWLSGQPCAADPKLERFVDLESERWITPTSDRPRDAQTQQPIASRWLDAERLVLVDGSRLRVIEPRA